MRLSNEKSGELLEDVRREMVINPNVTIFEIQERLNEQHNRLFDKNFIAKPKNKVHRERRARVSNSIAYELASLEDTINEPCAILWGIVDDEKSSASVKIYAIRQILANRSLLFDAMLNAGVFERNLGRETVERKLTPEDNAFIAQALEWVRSHKQEVAVSSKN